MPDLIRDLMFEMVSSEDGPPRWIKILPGDDIVRGRDGRAWRNPDPIQILGYIDQMGRDLIVDENHASEMRSGDGAPAMGRIVQVVMRADRSLWAEVDWTPPGLNHLRDKTYRWTSPAILSSREGADPESGILGTIVGLTSVGLVNSPNLALPALNSEEPQMTAPVTKDTAPAAEMIPVGQHNLVLARVAALETELAEARAAGKAAHETAVNFALKEATDAGKIAPDEATQGYFRSQCSTIQGLDGFQTWAKSAPAVVNLNSQALGTPATPAPVLGVAGLTPEQIALCSQMDLNPETFAKVLASTRKES